MKTKSQLLTVLSAVLITLGIVTGVYAIAESQGKLAGPSMITVYECDANLVQSVVDQELKMHGLIATESAEATVEAQPEVSL